MLLTMASKDIAQSILSRVALVLIRIKSQLRNATKSTDGALAIVKVV